MKCPYGICDFRKIIAQDYFLLRPGRPDSSLGKRRVSAFSSAPREFGKSLLLSMLSNYNDVAKKEEFGVLFGRLKIVKKSRPVRLALLQRDALSERNKAGYQVAPPSTAARRS